MANYQVRFGGGRLEKQVKLLAGRLPDLFGINADRVKSEVRDRVIRYQEECYHILASAFLRQAPSPASIALAQVRDMGLAIAALAEQQMEMEQRITGTESRLDRAAAVVGELRQRVGHIEKRLAPGKVITEEQTAEISQAVKALAELLTAQGEKKNHYQSIFNELYRRFGVSSYKNIPQGQYAAVMTFLEAWRLSVTV